MTTTVLSQPRSMAFAQAVNKPVLKRVWSALQSVGASRAVAELHREAKLRAHSNPELSRQMLQIARGITVE